MASDGRPHKHVCLTTEVLMCFQGDSDLDDMLSGQSDSILGGNDDAMYDGDSAVHMQANDVTDPAICTREMDSSDSERREVSLLQHKGIVCQSRWWRWWVCWGREQWWWWDDVGEDEGDKNDGKNSGEDDGKDDGDAGGEDDGDGSDRSSSDSTSVAARWNTYRSHLVEAVDKGRVPHEVEVEAVDKGRVPHEVEAVYKGRVPHEDGVASEGEIEPRYQSVQNLYLYQILSLKGQKNFIPLEKLVLTNLLL